MKETYLHLRGVRVKNHLGKTTLNIPTQYYSPDLPVIGSLVQHENDALDHVAIEAGSMYEPRFVWPRKFLEPRPCPWNWINLRQGMTYQVTGLGGRDGMVSLPAVLLEFASRGSKDCDMCRACDTHHSSRWPQCCQHNSMCCSQLAAACQHCDKHDLINFCNKHFKRCFHDLQNAPNDGVKEQGKVGNTENNGKGGISCWKASGKPEYNRIHILAPKVSSSCSDGTFAASRLSHGQLVGIQERGERKHVRREGLARGCVGGGGRGGVGAGGGTGTGVGGVGTCLGVGVLGGLGGAGGADMVGAGGSGGCGDEDDDDDVKSTDCSDCIISYTLSNKAKAVLISYPIGPNRWSEHGCGRETTSTLDNFVAECVPSYHELARTSQPELAPATGVLNIHYLRLLVHSVHIPPILPLVNSVPILPVLMLVHSVHILPTPLLVHPVQIPPVLPLVHSMHVTPTLMLVHSMHISPTLLLVHSVHIPPTLLLVHSVHIPPTLLHFLLVYLPFTRIRRWHLPIVGITVKPVGEAIQTRFLVRYDNDIGALGIATLCARTQISARVAIIKLFDTTWDDGYLFWHDWPVHAREVLRGRHIPFPSRKTYVLGSIAGVSNAVPLLANFRHPPYIL
uniref:Uncharacterized protein n=1 Tax=Timema shepardi TaxID=629360 RepID=A0A7R9AYL6_TIMSH|nr:unnamed protein product [Timema shepardi]